MFGCVFKSVWLSRAPAALRVPQPDEQPPWAAARVREEKVVLSLVSMKLRTERFPGNKTAAEQRTCLRDLERMEKGCWLYKIMISMTTA